MTSGSQSNQGKRRNEIHFVRGQVHVFVMHRPRMSADEIIDRIRSTGVLERPLQRRGKWYDPPHHGQTGGQAQIYYSADRVVTFDPSRFPNGQDDMQAYSLVFINIPALGKEQQLLAYLREVYDEVAETPGDSVFKIAQVTPNWLTAGSPEADGSGGPGGTPVAPSAGAVTQSAADTDIYSIIGSGIVSEPTQLAQRGACVDVFILDTAPCDFDLQRGYKKWVDDPIAASGTPHPILHGLLGPGGALRDTSGNLRITYGGHSHLLELINAYMPDHDYVMADHGLFIAGIINKYAPAARLHLIEVLNPYGMGTIETIAQGFARAAEFKEANPDAKVVVNASLFIEVGTNHAPSQAVLSQNDPFWNTIPPQLFDGEFAPILSVCTFLNTYAAKIVAAAGNNGTKKPNPQTNALEDFHPVARYPAAYNSVLGVAALGADGKLASYTNQADVPVAAGAAIFGGEEVGNETDPANGVVGVYIGAYPNGVPNTSGYASWSGTSFAAPVISAGLAVLLCEKDSEGNDIAPQAAVNLIKAVFASPPDETEDS